MEPQDRKLVELYARLQQKVHTEPLLRPHLMALERRLRRRRVTAQELNQAWLEQRIAEEEAILKRQELGQYH